MAAPQLFALQNHAGLRRAVLKGRKAGQSSPLAGFQESPRLTDETEALGTVGSGSVLSLGMYPTSSISIDSSWTVWSAESWDSNHHLAPPWLQRWTRAQFLGDALSCPLPGLAGGLPCRECEHHSAFWFFCALYSCPKIWQACPGMKPAPLPRCWADLVPLPAPFPHLASPATPGA